MVLLRIGTPFSRMLLVHTLSLKIMGCSFINWIKFWSSNQSILHHSKRHPSLLLRKLGISLVVCLLCIILSWLNFHNVDYERSCPFGDKFYKLFFEWALELQWPQQPSNFCVSSLELYVDFLHLPSNTWSCFSQKQGF